ncbi:chromosome segregation protein SMC [Xanthomonas oryzae pv. oryzae]|nr:chromosome segregation protein SMC [Xanthomonas oryzae pv. oryzae]RBC29381.1 chromosome segregation protein SMC [Xanthomonas oryzae pv. oryzae]RBC42646.1 chromosome segregation protein SMC [Xanthomonas oryzae pv. oryzae]RBC61968.1 chromosome segregation protein SMC [Xanthomonas oryzae pv. oryzae]RBE42300.1 chromosome segregation protein SMC [Xanthomonas oryzae pv. oryzae]
MAAEGLVRDQRKPSEKEIDALADHCLEEAATTLAAKHPSLAPGAIFGTPDAESLRIDSLSTIRGVNSIGTEAVLDLSKGHMTVVYGSNGAGKSGYARLIKHLCGARAKGTIYGNVFQENHQAASAQVTITTCSAIDGTITRTRLSWEAATGPHPKLNSVPVFDSATAMEFGETSSEATYLPRSMRFVGALISIADRVGTCLQARASQLQTQLLVTPTEHAQTTAGRFLQSVRDTFDHEAISNACAFPAALLEERLALETALAEVDPAAAHAKAIMDLNRLAAFAEEMAELKEALCNEKALGLIVARTIAADKRQAATAYAAAFVQGMPLKGVGDTVWEALWEAAKAYSTGHAYPEHAYPHVEDRACCVLCQQPLEADGKDRLKSFEQYLNSTLQTQAKAAEDTLATLTLPALKDATTPGWQAHCAAVGLDNEQATALAKDINARINAMGSAIAMSDVPAIGWSLWEDALASTIATTTAQRDALATLLDPAGRGQKEARLREIKAQEWLAGQIEAVKAEVERLKKLAILAKAQNLTKTSSLTTKSNEIGKLELAQGYCDRFNAELKSLGGGRLPVRMSHKSSGKGIYSFYIELKDAASQVKNRDVLSEGEQRIVALAAFFADATGTDRALPIIFDDPISSLDQLYEEAVAKRLVILAEQRQVIIFTHRLSLLVLLKSAAEQRPSQALAPVVVTTASIGRDGASTGMPSTIDAFSLKPKAGFEQIKSSVSALKKQDAAMRAMLLKTHCSNFRILLERSIEDELCSGVINRFRREVKTINLLQRLHAITSEDCALINRMMTKYSAFEHSQPTETPSSLPQPDELLEDVQTMLDWIRDFNDRAKKAVA